MTFVENFGTRATRDVLRVVLSVLAIWKLSDSRTVADMIDFSKNVGFVGASAAAAIILYVLFLAVPLYRVGRAGGGREE